MIILLIIISLFYYIYINERKNDPEKSLNNKSYPHKNDNISTLLDRIEWSSLHHTRENVLSKYLLWGLWITFLQNLIFNNNSKSYFLFLKMWLFVTCILMFLQNFYYWHADKFRDIGIIDSVNLLRKKLKKKKGNLEKLSEMSGELIPGTYPWPWTHKDYLQGTAIDYSFSNNLH